MTPTRCPDCGGTKFRKLNGMTICQGKNCRRVVAGLKASEQPPRTNRRGRPRR